MIRDKNDKEEKKVVQISFDIGISHIMAKFNSHGGIYGDFSNFLSLAIFQAMEISLEELMTQNYDYQEHFSMIWEEMPAVTINLITIPLLKWQINHKERLNRQFRHIFQ